MPTSPAAGAATAPGSASASGGGWNGSVSLKPVSGSPAAPGRGAAADRWALLRRAAKSWVSATAPAGRAAAPVVVAVAPGVLPPPAADAALVGVVAYGDGATVTGAGGDCAEDTTWSRVAPRRTACTQ